MDEPGAAATQPKRGSAAGGWRRAGSKIHAVQVFTQDQERCAEPKVSMGAKPLEQFANNLQTGGVSLDLIKAGYPRSRSATE